MNRVPVILNVSKQLLETPAHVLKLSCYNFAGSTQIAFWDLASVASSFHVLDSIMVKSMILLH